MPPLVSVIIPAFNRADYLPEAIASVLTQPFQNLEVIVVDDGSTDHTAEVVKRFSGEPRVRYLYQPNQGRSVARNHGAQVAAGDYLGFLDSDDRYLPQGLEVHLQTFAADSNLGLSIGGYDYIDDAGQFIGVRQPWAEGGDLDPRGWLFNGYAMPGSILLKRAWFERSGGFDPACEIAEDWSLCLQLLRLHCPMTWTKHSVCSYRQHAGASVKEFARHRDGALQSLEKYFSHSDVPTEIVSLKNKALAWVYVVYARKGYGAGQGALAANDLERAVELDPELAGERRDQLIEFLITPTLGENRGTHAISDALLLHRPRTLPVDKNLLRRAQARVEMAKFFRSVQQNDSEQAAACLRNALKNDAAWLFNRGVIAFIVRYLLPQPGRRV